MDEQVGRVRVELFGSGHVQIDQTVVSERLARKEIWLLASLVLNGNRPVTRERIAARLWPDVDEAQLLYNLRRALSHLRTALGAHADRIRSLKPASLLFVGDGATIDVADFDRLIGIGTPKALAQALEIYTAPLLHDCLEEWAHAERVKREIDSHRAMERLAVDASEREDWSEAARYARRLTAVDPLNEAAHRLLMTALAKSGSPAGAVQTYRDLRIRLRAEVNSEPETATRALYESIRHQARSTDLKPMGLHPHSAAAPDERAPQQSPLPTPRRLSNLIGRRDELDRIFALLSVQRIITLTGVGGVGKTRLAIEVCHKAMDRFENRAAFVDLSALKDADLIAPAIARALEIELDAAAPPLLSLCRRLRGFNGLIVLDNCEQIVAGAAAACRALLDACPGLRLLTTSREPLMIPGETACTVAPLAAPPDRDNAPTFKDEDDQTLEYPAVQLFLERVRQSHPDLRIGRADYAVIGQICRRLDGIPLALELAASRVRSLSLSQIAAKLENPLRLLRGGIRTSQAHHATLEAVLDWSYQLLDTTERRLFERLSVFCDGWTLEAAQTVCADPADTAGGIDAWETIDGLTALVDKSLVARRSEGNDYRYAFLETVRAFAGQRLLENQPGRILSERHLNYFSALAVEARPHFLGPDQNVWLSRIAADHNNVRAAFDFGLSLLPEATASAVDKTPITVRRQAEATAQQMLAFAHAMATFWIIRSLLVEARQRLGAVLSLTAHLPLDDGIANLLNALGVVSTHQDDHAAAESFLKRSLEISRRRGDPHKIATSEVNLANVMAELGDLQSALTLYTDAIAGLKSVGNEVNLAVALSRLGRLYTVRGEYDAARSRLEESIAIRRRLGDRRGEAMALVNLGSVLAAVGEPRNARALVEQAAAIYREQGDLLNLSVALANLGNRLAEDGDAAGAELQYRESISLSRQVGSASLETLGLSYLGRLRTEEQDLRSARSALRDAIASCRTVQDKSVAATLLECLAAFFRVSCSPIEAARLLGRAEALYRDGCIVLSPREASRTDRLRLALQKAAGAGDFQAASQQGATTDTERLLEDAAQQLQA